MKSLFVDIDRFDVFFYLKDKENRVIKKSRPLKKPTQMNIVDKIFDIIGAHPTIGEIEIDAGFMGECISDCLKFKLKQAQREDIKVLLYRFMAL